MLRIVVKKRQKFSTLNSGVSNCHLYLFLNKENWIEHLKKARLALFF